MKLSLNDRQNCQKITIIDGCKAPDAPSAIFEKTYYVNFLGAVAPNLPMACMLVRPASVAAAAAAADEGGRT
jgi:hypothetical protein